MYCNRQQLRLKIDEITRKAVQADYNISKQDWARFLDSIEETVRAVEGNRQVPLF